MLMRLLAMLYPTGALDPLPWTLSCAIASFRRNVTQRVSRQRLLQKVFSADNITTILHQQLR